MPPARFSALPAGMTSAPVPPIVPAVQLSTVPTVRLPVPLSVPPVMSSLAAVTLAPSVSVPPARRQVPVPESDAPALRVCVPLLNSRTPVVAVNAPVLVPPAYSRTSPRCACTVPVLFIAQLHSRLPVPADLRKVPALLNRAGSPP